jgi:hypothetical protein
MAAWTDRPPRRQCPAYGHYEYSRSLAVASATSGSECGTAIVRCSGCTTIGYRARLSAPNKRSHKRAALLMAQIDGRSGAKPNPQGQLRRTAPLVQPHAVAVAAVVPTANAKAQRTAAAAGFRARGAARGTHGYLEGCCSPYSRGAEARLRGGRAGQCRTGVPSMSPDPAPIAGCQPARPHARTPMGSAYRSSEYTWGCYSGYSPGTQRVLTGTSAAPEAHSVHTRRRGYSRVLPIDSCPPLSVAGRAVAAARMAWATRFIAAARMLSRRMYGRRIYSRRTCGRRIHGRRTYSRLRPTYAEPLGLLEGYPCGTPEDRVSTAGVPHGGVLGVYREVLADALTRNRGLRRTEGRYSRVLGVPRREHCGGRKAGTREYSGCRGVSRQSTDVSRVMTRSSCMRDDAATAPAREGTGMGGGRTPRGGGAARV